MDFGLKESLGPEKYFVIVWCVVVEIVDSQVPSTVTGGVPTENSIVDLSTAIAAIQLSWTSLSGSMIEASWADFGCLPM